MKINTSRSTFRKKLKTHEDNTIVSPVLYLRFFVKH